MTEPYVRPDYWEFGYAEFDQLTMQATGSSMSGSTANLSTLVNFSATGSSTSASTAKLNINVVFRASSSSVSSSYAEMIKSNTDYTYATTVIRDSVATAIQGGSLRTFTANQARFEETILGANKGLLLEASATNFVHNSEVVASSRTISLAAGTYTLSFSGTGTVTLSGGATGSTSGLGNFPATRATRTFTANGSNVVLSVTGYVEYVQVEAGSFATSWIPTNGSPVTRKSDKFSIPFAAVDGILRTFRTTVVLDIEEKFNKACDLLVLNDNSVNFKIVVSKTTTTITCAVFNNNVQVATQTISKPVDSRYILAVTSGPRGIAFAVNTDARMLTDTFRLTRLGTTFIGTTSTSVDNATDINANIYDVRFIHKEFNLAEITQMSNPANYTVASTND